MDGDSLALGFAFVTVAVGLAILLAGEAVGAGIAVVAGGGGVALAGIALLTGVVMRLPDPASRTH